MAFGRTGSGTNAGGYEPVFGGAGKRLVQCLPYGAIDTLLHVRECMGVGVHSIGDLTSGDSKPLVILGDLHRRLLSAIHDRDGYRTVFCLRSYYRFSDRVLAAAATPNPVNRLSQSLRRRRPRLGLGQHFSRRPQGLFVRMRAS